jgi:hypothetical protein
MRRMGKRRVCWCWQRRGRADEEPDRGLTFGPGKGNVILSQVLTAGRLVRASAQAGFYGLRYDPAAAQFVLNMIAKAAAPAVGSGVK